MFDKVNERITPDMYQPQFIQDNQVFFEIPRSGIQWCCEEFEQRAGRNTVVTASSNERIHGITRWHIKCPYCGMALIASKYSMKPEK
jgi:hypothetical protein